MDRAQTPHLLGARAPTKLGIHSSPPTSSRETGKPTGHWLGKTPGLTVLIKKLTLALALGDSCHLSSLCTLAYRASRNQPRTDAKGPWM